MLNAHGRKSAKNGSRRNRVGENFLLVVSASLVAQLVKESTCIEGDLCSILGFERSPGGGHGNPLQYSCLESPMDSGGWRATVHGVTESDTTELSTAVCQAACLLSFIFLKIFFFLTWTVFKVCIEFVTILLLLFMFWCFGLDVCGNLRSPNRDRTHTSTLEGEVPTTGPPGMSLSLSSFSSYIFTPEHLLSSWIRIRFLLPGPTLLYWLCVF